MAFYTEIDEFKAISGGTITLKEENTSLRYLILRVTSINGVRTTMVLDSADAKRLRRDLTRYINGETE